MSDPITTPSGEFPILLAMDPARRQEHIPGKPIMSEAARKRHDEQVSMIGATAFVMEFDEDGALVWSPEEYTPDVNACIDAIESNIAGIADFNVFNIVMHFDSGMTVRDQYVRHRAILDYLEKVGLYDDYFNGPETRATGFTNNPHSENAPIARESWGVNIGYIPGKLRKGRNYYLRAEHRIGDDLKGHKFSLIAYRHDTRRGPPILPESHKL